MPSGGLTLLVGLSTRVTRTLSLNYIRPYACSPVEQNLEDSTSLECSVFTDSTPCAKILVDKGDEAMLPADTAAIPCGRAHWAASAREDGLP